MKDLLGGSALIGGCARLWKSLQSTASQSLLLGKKSRKEPPVEGAAVLKAANRFHPIDGLVKAMGESALFGWLYHYWGNLLAGPAFQLLFGLIPLFCCLAASMAAAARWMEVVLFLILLAISVLLFARKTPLGEWIGGSALLRRFPLPKGRLSRSIPLYLTLCGLLGGGLGWIGGAILGFGAGAALMLLPALFAIPPFWMVCLLCGLLPLMGTTACWAMSLLIGVLWLFRRAFAGAKGKAVDALDILLVVFPILCIASTLFSFAVMDSAKVAFMWLGLFFCVLFLRRVVDTRQKLIAALWALVLGAAASGCYGLFQYLSGKVDTTWTDTTLFEGLSLRVYSTFANPNVFGEFLLLAMPLCAALALYSKGRKRYLLLGIDLLLGVNLLLTYSRGCYVGLLLTALVFLWNFSKKWTVAGLVAAVPIALAVMPQSILDRILSIGNMSDTSTSFRMWIYIGTLFMLADYWFCGLGLGEKAFNAVYPLYALPAIVAPHSHSLFFQLVISFGILGLVYIILLLIGYQRRMRAARQRMPRRDRLLMLGFGSVFWGMLLQSVFDYTWYNYRVFQLFWIVLVLGFAAADILKQEEKHHG